MKKLIGLFITVTLVIGCSKSGGGGKDGEKIATTPIDGVPGDIIDICQNCGDELQFIASGVGKLNDWNGETLMEMELFFFGEGPVKEPYIGPVFIYGTMVVRKSDDQCGLRRGTFEVRTFEPGFMSNGKSFYEVDTTAGSGVDILFLNNFLRSVTPPIKAISGKNHPYQVRGHLLIEGRNNQWCDVIIE